MTDRQYPIGHYIYPDDITSGIIKQWIDEIESCPIQVRAAVEKMTEAQLDTPYREGGWTVRQVVHHLPESHMNAYIRTKLTLTENHPTVKPYEEAKWAELLDARTGPVSDSLDLLDALHKRWVIILRSLNSSDLSRTFYHPELKRDIRLDYLIGMYAWHGKHHLAHINLVK